MQEKRVNVEQIGVQVRDAEGRGEAVVFLHFSGANLMMWQRVIPDFLARYRVILMDLRGHGKSDEPESGYHMDIMARDVAGVMEQLGVARAHVIGSSLGAEVGLSMAVHYPDKVRSLVCDGALASAYGPYGTWEGSEEDFAAHVAEHLDKIRAAPQTVFPSLEALVAERRDLFEKYGWWTPYLEDVVRYGAYQVAEGKYARRFGKQALEDYLRHYYGYRFEDYYRDVTCPLLMLADKDSEDERERAAMRGLRALAAQAEIAEISGWAHPYCWLLNPQGASEVILGFLDRVAY
ncbi:MAG: alpha/beta hydrolase [Anaerolineae bacterium]|nr:alpha/beta hydrolase [Anaerolineae bacterium]